MKNKIVLTDEYFKVVPPESSPEMKKIFISYIDIFVLLFLLFDQRISRFAVLQNAKNSEQDVSYLTVSWFTLMFT